jgi:signal transduction histidine kinase
MRIFDPFFSTKQGEKGVGLGLSVVYGIVEAHDGRLSVHSQEGKGAVFTVRLPLQIAAPPAGTSDPRTP